LPKRIPTVPSAKGDIEVDEESIEVMFMEESLVAWVSDEPLLHAPIKVAIKIIAINFFIVDDFGLKKNQCIRYIFF
jgi:hypothetical protein